MNQIPCVTSASTNPSIPISEKLVIHTVTSRLDITAVRGFSTSADRSYIPHFRAQVAV